MPRVLLRVPSSQRPGWLVGTDGETLVDGDIGRVDGQMSGTQCDDRLRYKIHFSIPGSAPTITKGTVVKEGRGCLRLKVGFASLAARRVMYAVVSVDYLCFARAQVVHGSTGQEVAVTQ